MKRFILLAGAVAFALAGCATVGDAKATADLVGGLINQGQAERLAALSSAPFLVDREIVALPTDTAAFWKAFVAAGVKVDTRTPAKAVARGGAELAAFGGGFELRTFFAKYVDPKALAVELRTADGRSLLVVAKELGGKSVVYALKGPY